MVPAEPNILASLPTWITHANGVAAKIHTEAFIPKPHVDVVTAGKNVGTVTIGVFDEAGLDGRHRHEELPSRFWLLSISSGREWRWIRGVIVL